VTLVISVILEQVSIEKVQNFVLLVIIVLQEHFCQFHVQQKHTSVELVQETFHIVLLVNLAFTV
jgi:hypothetical protein